MMTSTKLNLITITKSIGIALCLIFSLGCQSLLYHPYTGKFHDPDRLKMVHEDVYYKSSDGNMLHAWYFPTTTHQAKGTLLFFHGNGQNLTSHFLTFRWLPDAGYNYLIFDYPGYGTSGGEASPEGTVKAGVAAAEWLMANKKPDSLIIYGSSLGGTIALRTAEEIKGKIPMSHIIIEGSFVSYQGIGRKVMSRSWITWLLQPLGYLVLSDKWAPKDISTLSPIQLLFISGDQDPVIEPENTKEMFKLAQEPKELWMIPGGHHGDTYEINNGEWRQRLLDYLSNGVMATTR
jgi:fermentation-respiration switch protein FrsA (DUF1100 family)